MYSLRVMVFVEYENEVEEERGRVEALLEKLRISAEVHVFWLANGNLTTYEAIVQGEADPTTEKLVDDVLGDSLWWSNLQEIRGKVTPRRNGGPDAGPSASNWKDDVPRRRPSIAHIQELQKHHTVSTLARLGVSMGIRTQNLAGQRPTHALYNGDDNGDDYSSAISDNSSTSDEDDFDTDFNDVESAASEGDIDDVVDEADAIRRPLLPAPARRKSHGDAIVQRPALRRKKTDESKRGKQAASTSAGPSSFVPAFIPSLTTASGRSYGTMSTVALSSISGQHSEDKSRQQQDTSLLTVHSTQCKSKHCPSSIIR